MGRLLPAGVATLVGLGLGELAVRGAIVVLHRTPIVVSNRNAGWAGCPDLHDVTVTMAGGQFRVSTDRWGHRIAYEPTHSVPTGLPAVVLLGDSFVFGLSVDDRDTFAWQLARDVPDHQIVNLGVPGYGTDQEFVGLEDLGRSAEGPEHVTDIVVVVFENDFLDVQRPFDRYLGRSKPVFRATRATLERGNFSLPMLDRIMDHSRLVWLVRSRLSSRRAQVPINADSGMPVVLAGLSAIRRLGEAEGARVHVFAHRRANQASLIADAVWAEFLRQSGAEDLTTLFQPSATDGDGESPIGFDGVHWSAEGHRRMARAIRRSLAEGSPPTSLAP